jgi:iron-sulfur cluster repair protein YtfE (RIC family)
MSTDMITIHRVFRREFALLPGLVRDVEAADRERADVLGTHLGLLLAVLHHHHDGEDLLLWPRLQERSAGSADLLTTTAAEHVALAARLTGLEAVSTSWRTAADAELGARLADAIDALRGPLDEHLTREERDILPLVDATLTPAEWGELGQRAFSLLTPGDAMTVLAQMAEESPAEEWRWFMAHLPEPVQTAYTEVAVPAYPGYVARIRGSSS